EVKERAGSLPRAAPASLVFAHLNPLPVVLLVAISSLWMALSGCSRPEGHALPVHPLVSKCQLGQMGSRFVFAAPASPRTFNPLFAFDPPSDAICRLLNGSLVNMNFATQEAGPGLAESWSTTPDGKTWTFKLRQGLRWSDGALLN